MKLTSLLSSTMILVAAVAGAQTPLLEFHFNEGAGTTALNSGSLGPGSNGGVSNAVYSADTPTGAGTSLLFDGIGSLVAIPDTFDYGNTVTVEAWIKPTAVNGQRAIFDDYGSPGVFLTVTDGLLQWNLTTAGHPGQGISIFAGLICPGVWTHVAGTYDGTTMRAYINGVQVGSVATSGNIVDNAGIRTTIGADNATPNALAFAGHIDEVRVWNTVLSPEQLGGGLAISNSPGPCIDVSVVKTDTPDPVLSGGLLFYDFEVRVFGDQPAQAVVLTDPLPAGMTFVDATVSQGTFQHNAGVVTFQLGTVTNQTTVTAGIWVTATGYGTITNTATVSTSSADTLAQNNTAFVVTTVQAVGNDLTIQYHGSAFDCIPTAKGDVCTSEGPLALANNGVAYGSANLTVTGTKVVKPGKPTKWKIAGLLDNIQFDLGINPPAFIQVYLSNDATLDLLDTPLLKKPVDTLLLDSLAGSFKTVKLKLTIPKGVDLSGKFLIAVVDYDDQVAESNENNNATALGPIP